MASPTAWWWKVNMDADNIKNLKVNLELYKELTLELIDSVEKDMLDDLDMLIQKRQNVINAVEQLTYDGESFNEISIELNLMVLQKKLTELMNEKKNEIKSKIEKLGENKIANKSYNKRFAVDSIYFNKKI